MKKISIYTKKYFVYMIIGLVFLGHLPFLSADPDIDISFSRGPFTDEGLNTIQVRNLINHGYLSITECDNLLKTPLFGASLYLPFRIFGTKLIVSRLFVLILVFISLFYMAHDKKFRGIALILALITFMQYQVFQFSHFSMAEMLSSTSVLLSIYFLIQVYKEPEAIHHKTIYALLSAVFLSLAYFFKIQFIYIVVLLPLIAVDRIIFEKTIPKSILIKSGLVITSVILIFLLIYLLGWYLPFRKEYDMMMAHQSGEFTFSSRTWELIRFNFSYFLFSGWMKYIIILLVVTMPAGVLLLYKNVSSSYPLVFKSSLLWLIIEMHKLTMAYLPTRYRISMYLAIGLLISVVLHEIYLLSGNASFTPSVRKIIRAALIILVLSVFSIHLNNYYKTLLRRNYSLKNANEYLANFDFADRPVIGAWAPAVTWECKARAIPVWNGFLNYQDPLKTFDPKIVVSEPDQKDSEEAYLKQGINLIESSDSVKYYQFGQWQVNLYWIKSKE